MATPPSWMERCLATIDRYDSTDTAELAGILDRSSFEMNIGDKPVTGVPVLTGGRFYKYDSIEDTDLSFDLYVKDLSLAQGSLDLLFFGTAGGVLPSGSKIQHTFTHERLKCRLVITFTNDPRVTTATGLLNEQDAGTEEYAARRHIFADAFITSYKANMGDHVLKFSPTIMVPPFDSAGDANYRFESLLGDSADELDALNDYDASNKW